MAKKSQSKKKNTNSWKQRHGFKLFVIAAVLLAASPVLYNKYLDWKNVQDMKSLLSEFEKLKVELEKSGTQTYYIDADCGSGPEKFSTSFSCRIVLPADGEDATAYSVLPENIFRTFDGCEILEGGRENFKNALRCSVEVRPSNKEIARTIFY